MPRLIFFFAVFAVSTQVLAAPAANPSAEDCTIFDKPGKIITALCATDEAVWIGTEDRGLWRLDLKADPAKTGAWQQFTAKDTATDHVYGIAVDILGRVWIGTLNQGVSVYNGKEWRNFGVLDGCSGERVFAIAADPDPKRGNVWIGTDHGLVCWSPDLAASPAGAKGKWRTYTQAAGLPSQQIYAIAVAPFGRVWVGTECDGLAWADPPYEKWQSVRADAEKSGDAGEAPGCGGGTAPGLPSNLTNGLAVLKDGTTIVSTNYGLGIRRAGELAWTTWQGLSKQPYENHTRGLAIDPAGGLWIATRHKGLARLDLKTSELKVYSHIDAKNVARPPSGVEPVAEPGAAVPQKPTPPPSLPDDYVFSVAVTAGGDVWAGTYGGGLARLKTPLAAPRSPAIVPRLPVPAAVNPQLVAPLPEPLGPPTLAELNAMLAELAKVPFVPPEKQPAVTRLGDDWLTKGDWLGRMGLGGYVLCSYNGPHDILGGTRLGYRAYLGGNHQAGDGLRHWIHWLFTDEPRSLEIPHTQMQVEVGMGRTTLAKPRRQAEWDDHGEAYAMSSNGPGILCDIQVPRGTFRLGLYFFNKDGHDRANRFRDYTIVFKKINQEGDRERDYATNEEQQAFDQAPMFARGRVRDFWGGTYKQFLLSGPGRCTLQVGRNHSFNTILMGLFLDTFEEEPYPWVRKSAEQRQAQAKAVAEKQQQLQLEAHAGPGQPAPTRYAAASDALDAANRLMGAMEEMRLRNPGWQALEGRPIYIALGKYYAASGQEVTRWQDRTAIRQFAACCFHLGLYEQQERAYHILRKESIRDRLWARRSMPLDVAGDGRPVPPKKP